MNIGKSTANLPVWDDRTVVVNVAASGLSGGSPSHSSLRAALLAALPTCLDENLSGVLIGSATSGDILIGSTSLSKTAMDEGILIPGGTTAFIPLKDTVPSNLTYQSAAAIDVMLFYM